MHMNSPVQRLATTVDRIGASRGTPQRGAFMFQSYIRFPGRWEYTSDWGLCGGLLSRQYNHGPLDTGESVTLA